MKKLIFFFATIFATMFNSFGQKIYFTSCGIDDNTPTLFQDVVSIIETHCGYIIIDRNQSNMQYIKFDSMDYQSDTLFVNNEYNVKFVNIPDLYSIKIEKTASLEENKNNIAELLAYPNPASSEINVYFKQIEKDMPISIYSLTGALVYGNENTGYMGGRDVQDSFTINVSDLAEGMYIIRVGDEKVTDKDGKVTNIFKFVKSSAIVRY